MTKWKREQLAHVHTNPATLRLEATQVESLEALLEERGIPLYWAQWPPGEDRHPSPGVITAQAQRIAEDLKSTGLVP